MLPETLRNHPFLVAVSNDAVTLQAEIEKKGLDANSEDIDEYQFYIMRVGYSLANLITWMEQIDHAVYYLADFSYSKGAKREGINRAHHLLYNVENYLIRLQSVYDRSLQLANNVFHLCIEESNVSHSVIVSNLKVSRTPIANLLRSLKRGIKRKEQERHEIVHRSSYQDPELRRLELFYMFSKETWRNSGSTSFETISYRRGQLMKEAVAKKKCEFIELNGIIFQEVDSLLSEFHKQYDKERLKLKLYVYETNA